MSYLLINMPPEPPGEDLKACRGCLATGVELHTLQGNGLGQIFGEFTTIAVTPSDGYPQYICTMCRHLVQKFFAFRTRCHTTMWTIQQMRANNEMVTTETLTGVDRTYLKLNIKISQTQYIDAASPIDEENIQNYKVDEIFIDEEGSEEKCALVSISNTDDDDDDDKPKSSDIMKRKSNRNKGVKKKSKEFDRDIFKEESTNTQKIYDELKNEEANIMFEVECIKEELDDDDYGNDSEDANTVNSANLIKTEEVKDKPKKATKRKAKKDKPKASKKGKPTKAASKKETKTKEDDEVDIDKLKVWTILSDEINAENHKSKNRKRKTPGYDDVKFMMKTAQKFSSSYNMDVNFLTIEEQRREIEAKKESIKYKQATYKCELCARVFTTEYTFTRHMLLHDEKNGEHECEVCRYRFSTRIRYLNHFNHLHTKTIVCRDCGVVKRFWTAAKNHFEWHGGAKINCELCDKQFSERKFYLNHVRNKHKECTSTCVLCNLPFNGAVGMKVHMDKSHRESVRCTTCNAVFVNAEVLSTHLEVSKDGCPSDNRACPLCGNTFPTEYLMKKHCEEEHYNNKKLKCDQCPKTFKTEKQLSDHILRHKKHNRMKPTPGTSVARKPKDQLPLFVCEVCGKEKPSLSSLKYHQRLHTGERPFKCDQCQKGFYLLQGLKTHLTTHTDDRKYKCPVCAKAFRQIGHRKAHLLTHTKQRPYGCSVCDKRYTTSSALRDHTDTAHRGLPARQWTKKK